MPLAFDMSANSYDDQKTKYDISLSFRGEAENDKVTEFRSMMDQIDNFNIDWAAKNSLELFGEDLTEKRAIVEDRYNSLVKHGKKAEYAPTIRVKLQTKFDSDEPEFQLFDHNREELQVYDPDSGSLNLSFLTRNTDVILLIEYTGLWVVGKKFGCSWKLVQGKVFVTGSAKGYAIVDDDDCDVPIETETVDDTAAVETMED